MNFYLLRFIVLNKYKLLLKKNYKKKNYVIVLKKIGSKNKIIEKVGAYNVSDKCLVINPFRLIYFISKGVSLSGAVMCILLRFKVIN